MSGNVKKDMKPPGGHFPEGALPDEPNRQKSYREDNDAMREIIKI